MVVLENRVIMNKDNKNRGSLLVEDPLSADNH